MSWDKLALYIIGAVVAVSLLLIILVKRPKKLKSDRFIASWLQLQGYCKDKASWHLAITDADKLLDAALKKRRIKGKSMGERMVSAQRTFTYNDELWFAHNLAKKLKNNNKAKLKESEVKKALIGFRQGLRDIGALPAPENEAQNE